MIICRLCASSLNEELFHLGSPQPTHIPLLSMYRMKQNKSGIQPSRCQRMRISPTAGLCAQPFHVWTLSIQKSSPRRNEGSEAAL
eukprot:929925-Amphidinium_carterae.1